MKHVERTQADGSATAIVGELDYERVIIGYVRRAEHGWECADWFGQWQGDLYPTALKAANAIP